MSLSDLFGDLGDDEDEEDDYRPDAAQISDIESADEIAPSAPAATNARESDSTPFSLGQELLKPMKPPEFESDDDSPITRPTEKRNNISSDDDADETSDLRQLNKNLFGSDNESDEDEVTKKSSPVKPDSPVEQKSPSRSPEESPKQTAETIADRPLQNADDFFKDSDDDDNVVSSTNKTTAADLFGSDIDDDSDAEKPGASAATATATQEEIFGSDLSMSDDEQVTKQRTAPTIGSDDEDDVGTRVQRSDGESDEDKVDEESELPVEMPLTDINLGDQLNLVKLPNFLSIDTRPFDPETYEDEIEDDNEITDDEGRSRLKLKVENTIRWRHALDDNGNLVKQSNSRVVKWSDGSMSFFVGSEEFDILKAPLTGAHSHLYVKHGAGIQGQAQFKSKMMFRIHSTDSYTHKKLTMRISDRVSKASKAKTLPAVGKNPEAQREELLKKEDERQAATRRRENMQKKIREKNMNKSISTRYLEPDIDEEDEGESLAAIKNSYKSGAPSKKQKTKQQKKVSEVYSSEEEEEEPLSEDEEEEAVATDSDSGEDKKKQKKKPTIIDDEEESDD